MKFIFLFSLLFLSLLINNTFCACGCCGLRGHNAVSCKRKPCPKYQLNQKSRHCEICGSSSHIASNKRCPGKNYGNFF
jgi:hypothetical protein